MLVPYQPFHMLNARWVYANYFCVVVGVGMTGLYRAGFQTNGEEDKRNAGGEAALHHSGLHSGAKELYTLMDANGK